ncbi:heavy metal translocating P-type ATPase [uncultured Pseudomonas sp.]|uniref:heavy metal translocating P-type ATPase n=1 Tax=uncultured Pseudomonas sp. TaxID=114707 RepID=UPI0025E61921|nr:heavy metal translocating P-type ATPase [uncultured Pseudomonas sp.]
MHEFELSISGMTCAACAGRVERALQKVPAVTAAGVNLASEKARVSAPPEAAPALVDAISAAGYQVAEAEHDLALAGMSCANCAGRIEKALRAVPGVLAAEVNLASERARVQTLAAVDTQTLIAAVEAAGYGAQDRRTEEEHSAETRQGLPWERLELALALLLAVPLVLPMLLAPFGWHLMPPAWAQFLLASPVQFLVGARFYRGAWHALRARSGSMDVLVALGTSAAYGLSLYLWLVKDSPHLYFETAAMVIALVRLGKYLEARAKRRTGAALRALEALRPERARRLGATGQEEEVALTQLRLGDRLQIRPGERIPADGRILRGDSQVDEALLTGESRPVAKGPGDEVVGGAINGEGNLQIEVAALGGETVLAGIIRLVEDAQATKAPIQQLVDRISRIFVPVVVGVALLTLAGWLLTGHALEPALLAAVAVLVIACPCALGLATPAALMAGTGVAARHGILIKDAETLERAQGITTVVFDKTGTLTAGQLRLRQLVMAPGIEEAELLSLAGSLQRGSEHPLAAAVLTACRERGLDTPPAQDVRALPGRGLQGSWQGRPLLLGNARLLAEQGLDAGPLANTAQAWEDQGLTLSWLLESGAQPRVLGLLAFGDELRPGAAEAIARLRALGIDSCLLTGDNRGSARQVATALGITQWEAEVLPADKAAVVARLQGSRGGVAMVGDGLNDAPALAAAELGIAMGSGTAAARHAAGITLLQEDPRQVVAALDIARRTQRKIRQNLFWAFVYNVIGLPLAALGLLDPVYAGAAMAFSSVSVLANALLLGRWRPSGDHSS